MEITEFDLRFTDPDLADAIAKAAPPPGFRIVASSPMINASQGAAIIYHIAIHLPNGISITDDLTINNPALLLIAGWLAGHLKNKVKDRKNKKAYVNNDIIDLDETNIISVVRKDIAAQIARERQWAEHHKHNDSGGHKDA